MKPEIVCFECNGHQRIATCARCKSRLVLAAGIKQCRDEPWGWWKHLYSGNHRLCSAPYPTNELLDDNWDVCPCTRDECDCVACRQDKIRLAHLADCGVHKVGNNPLAWKQSDCTCDTGEDCNGSEPIKQNSAMLAHLRTADELQRARARVAELETDNEWRCPYAVGHLPSTEQSDIFVVCIENDYGVCHDAGFFTSRGDAQHWVFQAHRDSLSRHEEIRSSLGPEELDDCEYTPPAYYVVPLEPGNTAKPQHETGTAF